MAEHFEAWSSCFNLSVVAWLHLTSLKVGNAWCYVLPFLCLRNSVPSSVISFHSRVHCVHSLFPSKKCGSFFSNSVAGWLPGKDMVHLIRRHRLRWCRLSKGRLTLGPSCSSKTENSHFGITEYHRCLFLWGVVIVV